jgi:hypothetical protein
MCVMNALVTRLARRHVHSHSNHLPVNERQTYQTLLMVMARNTRFYGSCLWILICNAGAVTGGCRMSRVRHTACLRERVCERCCLFVRLDSRGAHNAAGEPHAACERHWLEHLKKTVIVTDGVRNSLIYTKYNGISHIEGVQY